LPTVVLAEVGFGLVLLAFLLSLGLGWAARIWAPAFGLVDRPGGRKKHGKVTPLGGGVAIWLATALVLLAGALLVASGGGGLPSELAVHLGGLKQRLGLLGLVFGLATGIMILGLCDDRFGLTWRVRFAAQTLAAGILVSMGTRITLFPPFSNVYLTGFLTVLWIVGLTNAFNFLDNMDALAASVGLIVAVLFAAAQLAVGSLFVPAVLLCLAGALAGFLVHNHSPARLFMGDAGSNFLGFLLGSLTVAGTFYREGYSRFSVLSPLVVMAIPLYDMISVIFIRLREGRSPFQPDRRHFSHRLVELGFSGPMAVATIDLTTLASGCGALLLHRLGPFGAGVVLTQSLLILGVVACLEATIQAPSAKGELEERNDGPA
jgi:UDP-GlcNAc:undecaprenyl-phosphate/decaprenyl-phosphate GlcNAc-1-phosphate transferase